MKHLAFIFSQAPYGNSQGREGLDSLLAASAFSKHIEVFFIGDGILQLLPNQSPRIILMHDHIAAFAMMSLCDITNVYLCQESIKERGLQNIKKWAVGCHIDNLQKIKRRLDKSDVILKF